MRETVYILEGRIASQKDLESPEEGAHRNFMKFNKVKSKILHLERKNSLQRYRLRTDGLESCIKRIWGPVRQEAEHDTVVCMSAMQPKSILNFIKESTVRTLRNVTNPSAQHSLNYI